MDSNKTQVVIGLTGATCSAAGLNIALDRLQRIQLPESFSSDDVFRMQRDCEVLAARLKNNPGEVAAFLEAVVQNRTKDAQDLARQLKMTEQDFIAEGGGIAWGAVIVAVAVGAAILSYARDAH